MSSNSDIRKPDIYSFYDIYKAIGNLNRFIKKTG